MMKVAPACNMRDGITGDDESCFWTRGEGLIFVLLEEKNSDTVWDD
jgi:hypothetical protein